jgi:hypothetical protein
VKLEKPDDFSQARISNTDFEKPQKREPGLRLLSQLAGSFIIPVASPDVPELN